MEVSSYQDGFLEGISKTYDEEGNLKTECNYSKDAIIGDKITYHKNGTIAMISPYKNGREHGITKKYSQTGDLLEEWSFENGHLKSKKDYSLDLKL